MKEPAVETILEQLLITTPVAAKAIGFSAGTLQNHRTQRRGLPYVKIGRKVFYDTADIRKFIEDNKIRHD